ncbi:MAG TPA: flagellar basal-body rod protein FlgG [Noviherbaspirillum sp.]
MNDALYIAATGMQMQQLNVDTIANNLANVNTTGFKKGQVTFQALVRSGLTQAVAPDSAEGIPPTPLGAGVALASSAKLFAQGELKKTDNPLDVAIRGDGFLELELPDGTSAYTRGGTLIVNKDGLLATAEGYPLKPNIHVGSDVKDISIAADGRVTIGGSNAPQEVGRIELAGFSDLTGLESAGGNMYRPTERSGDAIYSMPGEDNAGSIAQGYTEASNVKLIDEMVNLMVAQRAYEMSVKVIQASDDMLAMSNNLRR